MVNSVPSRKRTILAVDDKIENLKLLINYLEDSGFELMVAQCGEETFEHIERVLPDMILLDVMMPGIDGFETCRRLKNNPHTRHIPVVFMTALTDTVDKVKGFEAGAIDYLTKPLRYEEVLARVNAHMNTVAFQEKLQETNVLLQQKITVFSTLMQMGAYSGPIIAGSPAMRRVQEHIAQYAPRPDPILITGEPGTGKAFIAKKIHEHRGKTYAPLIVVDCLQIEEKEAEKLLFGVVNPERAAHRMGGFGALHLADQGTLILRHIEVLDMTSQKLLSQYLEEPFCKQDRPNTRLIATSSENITFLAKSGSFLPELAAQLAKNEFKIPNMRQRKRDILPLAEFFLTESKQRRQDTTYRIGRSAQQAILSGQYQQRNADELREAVEVAALFADGPELVAEHIFTGPKSEGTPFDYDLMSLRIVKWVLRSEMPLVVLQAVVFMIFLSVIVIGIIVGNTATGRIANNIVWGIWEPMLLFVFLFIGRFWCTVCPLSSAGRIAQRLGSLKMNPPQWLMEHAGWLIVLLFFLVIWNEQIFHMTENPLGTSLLLSALMLGAILFSLLFKRETWCRYLCPLGSLGAVYAVAAPVYVRANPGVCSAQCNSHECFKGSRTSRGCPVFHHPLYTRDSHFCKMCFACLRSCPHGSAKLYFRAPFQSIWHQGDLSSTLTPLALVGFFLVLVLLAVRTTDFLDSPYSFTAAAVIAAAFGISLYRILPYLVSDRQFPDPTTATRVALALFVLGWGPFMAYHLQEVPVLDSFQIRIVEGSSFANILSIKEISIQLILQLAVLFGVLIFTLISLRRIRSRSGQRAVNVDQWGWRIILVLCSVYLVTAVVLLLL